MTKEIKKENQFQGKNFIINVLMAFLPTVVIITLFRTLGLPVGMSITGTIIFVSLIYLIGKIRMREIKIGPTTKTGITIIILMGIAIIFISPVFILHPVPIATYTAKNLPVSLVSAGGGVLVGMGTSLIVGPIGGVIAFSGISGITEYRIASYQIMMRYLETRQEKSFQEKGRGMTKAEEDQYKDEVMLEVKRYALWEVIPEAIIILSLFR